MRLITQTTSVLNDLILRVAPNTRRTSDYKFAFIVHPRSIEDIERKFVFFRYIPKKSALFISRHLWPITVSKITGLKSSKDNKYIDGFVIAVLPTAHQLMEDRKLALKRIIQACKLAEKKGARIIGLGGLTSSLSKGGLDLIGKVNANITTGHAYTSYNVTQNIFSLVDFMDLDKAKINIGVVGAAGSIGSTSAKILARNGFKNFTLVDLERKRTNCETLKKELHEINSSINITISHQINDIKECELIIAATNAPEALIQSKDLKFGAIVVDDAQPSDVHPDVFERNDVLVIEAGVTNTPNIRSNFDFGLKNDHDNFCCLAEVLILASNEWDRHYVINRATLDLVDDIALQGDRLNFKIGKFQNFHETITDAKLDFVKNCIHQI
jgi:fatty aldehyde-generating acyl-ACP reductase